MRIFLASVFICFFTACGAGPEAVNNDTEQLTIISISPTDGPTAGGTAIVLAGTAFASGAAVRIDGLACQNVLVDSATQIQCETPAHVSGTVDLSVTNPGGESVELTSAFTYTNGALPAPTVTSVNPSSGLLAVVNTVTFTGSGFTSSNGGTIGSIDGITCRTSNVLSASTMECDTPLAADGATAGSKAVEAMNPDAQNGVLNNAYDYRAAATYSEVRNDIILTYCTGCHTGATTSGISLDSYATLNSKVVSGDPANSTLYKRLNGQGGIMPQGGPPLSAAEIQMVGDWILDGAQNN